jgi:hypothetical protein
VFPLIERLWRSLEESRDDLQSLGSDTPDFTGSYTTLVDATFSEDFGT